MKFCFDPSPHTDLLRPAGEDAVQVTLTKIEVLHARFRDHTLKLFEKHHMTVVGFWRPADEQRATQQLVYLLAFPSQEEAVKSWKDFQADPEWKALKEVSEKDGRLVEKIDSVYLQPTDYSPLK